MRAPQRDAIFTARVAGQVAGVAMLGVAMLTSRLAMGESWVFPLQLLTALITGPDALETVRASTLLPGLLAHQLGPTFVWSRIFGLAVGYASRMKLPASLLLGAAIGAVASVVDVLLLMPEFQAQLHDENLWSRHVPAWLNWTLHLTFGLVLGATYWQLQPPRRFAGAIREKRV